MKNNALIPAIQFLQELALQSLTMCQLKLAKRKKFLSDKRYYLKLPRSATTLHALKTTPTLPPNLDS